MYNIHNTVKLVCVIKTLVAIQKWSLAQGWLYIWSKLEVNLKSLTVHEWKRQKMVLKFQTFVNCF